MITFEEIGPNDIQERVKRGGRWIPLTHIATISQLSPIILRFHLSGFNKLGPELSGWLENKPHGVSYRGTYTLISLTKKDMALFKLFFG